MPEDDAPQAGPSPLAPLSLAERDVLDPQDRREFERVLQWLRLGILASSVLLPIAFGPSTLPFFALTFVFGIGSYALIWVLLRYHPSTLLRWQLALRLLDCVLVFLVLINLNNYLHDAYYDAAYLLFVVAAAATHGRHGALWATAAAGGAVLLSRLLLMANGSLAVETRHFTDSIFYAVFFTIISLGVAFLMRRSGEVVMRRDRLWWEAVAERNRELEETARARDAALTAAEDAIRTRDEFLSAVSHDLKLPLTAIATMAQLLHREVIPGDQLETDRLHRRVGLIQGATARMRAQIDDLLDLVRLREGKMLQLAPAPTDLVALVRRVVATYDSSSERHNINVDAGQAVLRGIWDAGRLERVLDNLISNGLKYSPDGGELTVSLAPEHADNEMWAVIRVRDQGLGIPAADLPRVFERYHRASNVTGQIGGTGLGLTGARNIVEQHGGTISLESEEGRGTTVTVRLPLAKQPPDAER
jgi:signal transduction histidine kinase